MLEHLPQGTKANWHRVFGFLIFLPIYLDPQTFHSEYIVRIDLTHQCLTFDCIIDLEADVLPIKPVSVCL